MEIRFCNQAAHDALTKAKRVLIAAHKKPDGDTLGASSAMLNFCRRQGIAATAFCLDPIPEQYLFMPGTEVYTCDQAVFSDPSYDLLAVFDAGDLRFVVGALARQVNRGAAAVGRRTAANQRFASALDRQAAEKTAQARVGALVLTS